MKYIITQLTNNPVNQLQLIIVIIAVAIALIEIFIEPRLGIIRTKVVLWHGVKKRRWITIFDKRWFTYL